MYIVGLVLGVLLLIYGSMAVAAISFDSAPWAAGTFGLVMLGIAWRSRRSRSVISWVYAAYGVVFVLLGVWITIVAALGI
jgi:hypothetical protein